MKIKEYVNKLTYKEIALGVIGILILFMFVWGVSDSHAFYNNESVTIPLVNAKVGNFINPTEGNLRKESDFNLIVYMQSQENDNEYMIVDSVAVPAIGYTLDKTKSGCIPDGTKVTYSNSLLNSIADDGTVSFNVKESSTIPYQVVCRLFYKKDHTSDIVVYILEQDEDYGTIADSGKKYRYVGEIPDNNTYVYSNRYRCINGSVLSYSADTGFSFTASKPDVCYAYFNRK